jgi:hypothetical protein
MRGVPYLASSPTRFVKSQQKRTITCILLLGGKRGHSSFPMNVPPSRGDKTAIELFAKAAAHSKFLENGPGGATSPRIDIAAS